MGHRNFSKCIYANGNPDKWGHSPTPNTPFILASSTTDPVANTTTINVPIISAINIL
jgi:hypothetical protein